MSSVVDWWEGENGLDHELLPFTFMNGEQSPREFLRDRLGINPDCGVQMVMDAKFAEFPVDCTVVATGVSCKANLPVVRRILKHALPQLLMMRY